MQVKSLVSIIALGAAVAFGAPAYAQTMVGGTEISATDLPAVQAHCDELAAAPDSLATATDDETDTEGTEAEAPAAAEVAAGADTQSTSVDMASITLEACTEAGLIVAK